MKTIKITLSLGLSWYQNIWYCLSKSYRDKIERELKK